MHIIDIEYRHRVRDPCYKRYVRYVPFSACNAYEYRSSLFK